MTDEIYSSERPMNGRESNIETANITITTDTNGSGSQTVNFDREQSTVVDYVYHISTNEFCDVRYEETDPRTAYHAEVTVHIQNAPADTSVQVSVTRMAERTRR